MSPRQEFIMDLALELGMTVADLSARMTERELRQWNRYRLQKMFPSRRLELYCAQTAMLIAQTMGGNSECDLRDFIMEIDMNNDASDTISDEELQALKASIGFSPVKH